MTSQEKLIKEIKSLSDSIRKKNRALRLGISERDKFLETTFKPVIDPLKQVSRKLERVTEGDLILPVSQYDIKTEEELGEEEEDNNSELEEIEEEPEEFEDVQRKEDISEEEEEIYDSGPSNISKLGVDIRFKGNLGRKYVLKMLQSTIPNRNYHVYGARLEGEGLMIGDSRLDVDKQDNIIIGGKKYKGTRGLFELIFKSKPENYSNRDLATFKNVCLTTHAHRKNYKPAPSPIHRNQSVKYKNIISELFPTQMEIAKKRFLSSEEVIPFHTNRKRRKVNEKPPSGEGLLKNTYNTNIIFYNNVNKLVNRMRLIHEAIEAGHTGLQNEWVALIDELINRGIIE